MRHIVVGTAGHIDHGKSALVLALTGTDPDRLQEEKKRGITIDLGFAHTREDEVVLSFVDVPGHERFVRNMLAGIGGIDLVMLHVAANESVMPQTREHFDICRLLGVPAGLVVVTKADLVDADTLQVVRLEVQELVVGSFLEGAPVLPVSARTGQGLPDLRRQLRRLAAAVQERVDSGPPRLPIDRVFSARGFGTVVTGTLVAGHIVLDDELQLLPAGRRVKVRGLQVHGEARDEAQAGQRVAVNLTGTEVGEVARGDTLTGTDRVTVTQRLDAEVSLLPDALPLRHAARVRFHQGTREVTARIALAGGAELAAGATGFARLHLSLPAVLVAGDRFILRAPSPLRTIGGGRVLDPLPPRRGVRTAIARARFERLADQRALLAVAEEQGLSGLPIAQLVSRFGVSPDALAGTIARLESAGVVRIAGSLFAESRLAWMEQRLLAIVEDHHARLPLEEGIAREELRERISRSAASDVFDFVLARLTAGGRIVARDRVMLRSHSLALSDSEATVRDVLVATLERAALTPPDQAELQRQLQTDAEMVDRIARLLIRQQVLIRAGDLLFHHAPLERLKCDIRALKLEQEVLDVATFKERFRVSRKYAIPLLEYLDRERVTRRVGETRRIL